MQLKHVSVSWYKLTKSLYKEQYNLLMCFYSLNNKKVFRFTSFGLKYESNKNILLTKASLVKKIWYICI